MFKTFQKYWSKLNMNFTLFVFVIVFIYLILFFTNRKDEKSKCINYMTSSKCIIFTKCGKFAFGIQGHSIYKFDMKSKKQTTIAGQIYKHGFKDGFYKQSLFNDPRGLTFSKDEKLLFICDTNNHKIRTLNLKGYVQTYAGSVNGCSLGFTDEIMFSYPISCTFSQCGKFLYICEQIGDMKKIHLDWKMALRINRISIQKCLFINTFMVSYNHAANISLRNNFELTKYTIFASYFIHDQIVFDWNNNIISDIVKTIDNRFIIIANVTKSCINYICMQTNKTSKLMDIESPISLSCHPDGKRLFISTTNDKITCIDLPYVDLNNYIYSKIYQFSGIQKHVFQNIVN